MFMSLPILQQDLQTTTDLRASMVSEPRSFTGSASKRSHKADYEHQSLQKDDDAPDFAHLRVRQNDQDIDAK